MMERCIEMYQQVAHGTFGCSARNGSWRRVPSCQQEFEWKAFSQISLTRPRKALIERSMKKCAHPVPMPNESCCDVGIWHLCSVEASRLTSFHPSSRHTSACLVDSETPPQIHGIMDPQKTVMMLPRCFKLAEDSTNYQDAVFFNNLICEQARSLGFNLNCKTLPQGRASALL